MQNENKRRDASLDMTTGEPAGLLIRFAIPMLIGGIFQLLYNTVDTVVVGRFVSTDALAAIGATGTTTMFFMMMGGGVTNALSVIISQAEGAKQYDRMKTAVANAVYLLLAVGALLGCVAFFGADAWMGVLGTDPVIRGDSAAYIRIVCGLTIALMAYNGAAAVLRAIGDSRTPLYFLIFSSLLNVALDLIFVICFGWGVKGVAGATILSQALSAALSILYMLKKYPRLRPKAGSWKPDPETFRQFLSIGLPLVVQNAVLNVGMFVITAVINSFGKDTMAAYTIGSRVEQLATVSFSNVAFSFSVYAGQNFGAKRYDRIREGLRKGMIIIGSLALVSTLAMMLFARPLVFFFTENPDAEVVTRAIALIRIEASLFIVLGWIWMANSALRGVGAVKITLISSIVELVSKIGFSLLLPLAFGYIGVWMAAPIGWVLGLIPSLGYLLWWLKAPEERMGKMRMPEKKK